MQAPGAAGSQPRRGGTLAIDHGTKRSGLAFADALGISTRPLDTHQGPGDGPALLDRIERELQEREIARVLIGLPLNADGSEGSRCADVRAFAARVSRRFPDLQVALHDEHLTSKAAEERLRAAGRGGRAGRAQRDAWSALVLLEDWLLSHARNRDRSEPGSAPPGESAGAPTAS